MFRRRLCVFLGSWEALRNNPKIVFFFRFAFVLAFAD